MRLKVVAFGVKVGKMESLAKNRVGWLEAGDGGHLGKAGNGRKKSNHCTDCEWFLKCSIYYQTRRLWWLE